MPSDINFQELMANVEGNPQHQRTLRRINNMSPDQRAIADRMVADEAFADEEVKKLFTLAKMATQKSQKETELGIKWDELAAKKAVLDAEQNLASSTQNYLSWANPVAHVIGAGGLGLTGYNAWNQAKRADLLSKYMNTDNLLNVLGGKYGN
jgi:hypothetical protein